MKRLRSGEREETRGERISAGAEWVSSDERGDENLGEKIKGFGGRVKETAAKLPKAAKLGIILGLVLIVVLIAALSIYNATRPYVTLFTELNSSDMSQVVAYLQNAGVTDYQIVNDDTILVREGKEAGLKAAIYQEGITTSGFGYGRYLDNIGILTSESDRKTLTLYDLQDRLSATVRQFEGVKDAVVTISQNNGTNYLLSSNTITAKAGVVVTMETGRTLSAGQVAAIQNIFRTAVSGLEIEDITVEDTLGTPYLNGGEIASLTDAAETKMNLEAQQNEKARTAVLAILAPMYGIENVVVSANSTVDTSRTYSEVLKYLEPDWAVDGSTGGQGIIGRWVWDSGLIRGNEELAGGVVGTSTNADLNEYVINEGDIDGSETEIGTSGTKEYLVGTERTQRENQGGIVTDLMVAVSINSNKIALSDAEVARLIPLVARAAGISTEYENEKIAIVLGPFYTEEPPPETEPEETWLSAWWPFPDWMFYAAVGGVLLFIILLVTILLLRRKAKKKRRALEEAQAQAQAQALMQLGLGQEPSETPEEGADIMDMNTDRTMELRQNVRNFAEVNPAIAAQMLKNWLKGGEANG